MKFSLKWLSDFAPVERFFDEPEKLAERLTQAGLEAEAIEDQKARFQNIVVAQIKSSEKHPQAGRLSLCRVFDGSKSYSIVCGAKNYKAGDKAVLALPGAILPGGFKIKKARLRGAESEGMLASKKELGFPSKEEGIWILPPEAETGQSFAQFMGLGGALLDIAVPPNRPDCLSHKGLAREISCLFSLPLSEKNENKKVSLKKSAALSVKKSLLAEVKDPKACPRYCGRLIEGAEVKESPAWLKARLQSLGLKSINNVVDITNFVLWDRGQPLHAFDRDKIQSLSVDYARKGEKFLALDKSELILTEEDLAIRDKDKILALAGVIGGMDSSVTKGTTSFFIESAGFAPEKIRKTARRLGLETDSSYRFTRGIDLLAVKEAMDLACALIQQEAGGRVSGDYYDIQSLSSAAPARIKIRPEDWESRLGYKAAPDIFTSWMKRIGCKVWARGQSFELEPPSFRTDLKIKEDLIEELARLEGYGKIPENPPAGVSPKDSDRRFLSFQKLKGFLAGKGWLEAVNYSFCDPEFYREFLGDKLFLEDFSAEESRRAGEKNLSGGDSLNSNEPGQSASPALRKNSAAEGSPAGPSLKKQSFFVNNPISRQLSLMKPLLAPDLAKNILRNFRHNSKSGRIFELSPVFYKEGESYKQDWHLALALWGEPIDIWSEKKAKNIYHIKSALESLFEAFGLKGRAWRAPEKDIAFFHPKQGLILSFQNKSAGFLASLHPRFLKKHKIPLDIALAEISLKFLDLAPEKDIKFKPFSSLPPLERDLCFALPKSQPVDPVRKELKKSLGPLCASLELFDLYESAGGRSASFRALFSSKDKSLTDEQINAVLGQAVKSASAKFAIRLK